MEECDTNSFGYRFKNIIKSIIVSMIITVVMLLILAGILCFTDASEKIIDPIIIFISAFSILIGSYILMKKIKEKGLIYGIILGIIYMLIIYLISSFANMDFSVSSNSLIMIFLGIISGAIGGIIGVNVKL